VAVAAQEPLSLEYVLHLQDELKEIFTSFAAFGNRRLSKEQGGGVCEMDGARFAKLCKDCKLVDKKFTATDVDLTFSKVLHPAQPLRRCTQQACCLWPDSTAMLSWHQSNACNTKHVCGGC
jgi:p25-alpha